MRAIVALRIVSGLLFSSAAVVWFPDMTMYERTVFMVASLGWYATTVVVSLASPISAFMFGVALLGPTAIAWSVKQDFNGLFLAIFSIVIVFLIRQSTASAHAVMRSAIASRLREEELARSLERHSLDLESAMRAKSQFLAAASHDLRQPVTSMNLLLSAMNATRDEASLRAVAAKLEAPVQALEQILSSLLEVSRLEAGIIEVERRSCSTGEIVSPLIAEYRPRAAAKRIRLESSVAELPLFVDPDLVRRLLRNLIDNAIKFTDVGLGAAGGLPGPRQPGARGRRHRKGHSAESSTSASSRTTTRATTRNATAARASGWGWRSFAAWSSLLDGDVSVTSEPGRGTRFEVRLPNALDSYRGAKRRRERALDPHGPPGRVAACWWSKTTAWSSTRWPRSSGPWAWRRATRSTARTRWCRLRSDDSFPDLALVDYGLPGSLDGISLVRATAPAAAALRLPAGDRRHPTRGDPATRPMPGSRRCTSRCPSSA